MKNLERTKTNIECSHKNVRKEHGSLICLDCGLILDENVDFEIPIDDYYSESQKSYERNIRMRDSKALQDPKMRKKYEKIKILDKWYKDYETSFTEQKRAIEHLKSYDFNIDRTTSEAIKKRYLKYNRKHRRTYQNMVIIFLAIVWMEIKESTNTRIERYIKVCNELGHKINKKMLNNAMLKVKNTEVLWNRLKTTTKDIEIEIKEKIKILFQKDLNNISYKKVKEFIHEKSNFDKLIINMQLIADKLLSRISYKDLKNLNYKAFTAGLIYYVGQTLEKDMRKIFTQALIEETVNFSSTTIRKKFHILRNILGDPHELKNIVIN